MHKLVRSASTSGCEEVADTELSHVVVDDDQLECVQLEVASVSVQKVAAACMREQLCVEFTRKKTPVKRANYSLKAAGSLSLGLMSGQPSRTRDTAVSTTNNKKEIYKNIGYKPSRAPSPQRNET